MANEQFYPAGSLTGLNAAVNGQNVQWQQPPQQPQNDGSGSLTQLMQMLMQPRQQQPQGITGADIRYLAGNNGAHDSTANISNGGSLFSNPNFYNAQGQHTGPGAAPQSLGWAPPVTIAQGLPAMPNTNVSPGNSGIFNGMGQQLMPGTVPVPGFNPMPHPLQGLFNTPGMMA